MIPDNITLDHLLAAIERIRTEGVPQGQGSTGYDLEYEGQKFPPKLVVRWANKLANGEDLWDFSGGDETNSFLETKGFVIRPKRAKTDLHSALYDVFPRIWRCAVSGSWAVIRKEKLLSFEDFDPGRNYREHPIEEGRGKKNITPWVNELQSGDLIFLLDKQHFYGFAIARSNYNFEGPFLTLKDSKQPAIKIELLYEAEKPVEGAFSYMRVPATFSSFGRAGFKLDVVLSILEKEEPQAIERLRRLVQMSAQNETYEILNNSDSMTTHALNTILYGPPGTGKTYTTIEKALRILNEKEDIEACESMARATIKAQYDKRMKEGRIEFVTFHQSMSYEDFIEGIKPVDPEVSGGQIQYKVELGIFRKICQRASQQSHLENFDSIFDKMVDELVESGGLELKTKSQNKTFRLTVNSARNLVPIPQTEAQSTSMVVTKDHIRGFLTRESERWKPYTAAICDYLTARYQLSIAQEDNRNKPFVLIIDEINRGNIAQIFGELITLIEEDKRLGKNESLEITLRYSKKPFGVPPNLYIIGTMNTADRSVEALDTALRRRFSFEEMPPKPELKELDYEAIPGVKAGDLLRTINQRLEKLLDRDHLIGHSYFIHKEHWSLLDTFYRNVIPLFQEYFFGDYGKIGLVLGKGFVRKKEWDNKKDGFADFSDYENDGNFNDREVFEIVKYSTKSPVDYALNFGDKEVKMDFEKAVKLLMKKDIE